MVNVLLTVGDIHEDEESLKEAIPYTFVEIPKVGELVIGDPRVNRMIDDYKTKKGVYGVVLNYVRAIGHTKDKTVVMLGPRPDRIWAMCVYGSKQGDCFLCSVPRVGEQLLNTYLSDNWLYIRQVSYIGEAVMLTLGDEKPESFVHINDEFPVDVRIFNRDPVEVEVVNRHPLDVNIVR